MLRVLNLDASITFYTTLFDAPPTRKKADYAQWILEDPHLNFSIAERSGTTGIEHLGLQVETRAELDDLRHRIGRTDQAAYEEGETTCCYAHSDKTWVTDAQGVSWEAFYTHGYASTYRGDTAPEAQACCAEQCCT